MQKNQIDKSRASSAYAVKNYKNKKALKSAFFYKTVNRQCDERNKQQQKEEKKRTKQEQQKQELKKKTRSKRP